jgi:Zn-dependent protease with chaperone function
MTRNTTQQREHFQDLIRRAEKLGASDPSAYRRRIMLLALLGYLVLFGILFLLLALIAGTVWAALASTALLLLLLKKKLIFVLGYLVYAIGHALWVKVEPPQGYTLDIRHYPELADVLEELGRQLKTPGIHQVILTEEFNAGISQTPRLGVFGWQHNTLILGLPLLLALSPEQAKAVLAHELGHLSGNHSRFSAWIYRVRQTWYRVMQAFDAADNWGSRGLARFFDWYAPHFNAYSFTLARANEYEADALSAQLTSREAAAGALVTSHIGADYLGRHYWQPLIARADVQMNPAEDPFLGLARFLRNQPADTPPPQEDLVKAMDIETGYADTHPALKDRLDALAAAPRPPQPLQCSAAERWLGKRYASVLADFDQAWLARNGDAWAERFREAEAIRNKLAELNAKPEAELTQEECWQRAAWTEQQGEDALTLYRHYAATYPDDLDADLVIGRLLLDRGDQTGLTHLERATQKFALALAACNAAHAWFLRQGDQGQAEHWLRRAEAQVDRENAAQLERNDVTPKDELIESGLSRQVQDQLADQLKALGGIKHAWICRKAVQIEPEYGVYVLAFKPAGWFPSEAKQLARVVEHINGPGLTFFVMQGGKAGKLAKRVIKIGQQLM